MYNNIHVQTSNNTNKIQCTKNYSIFLHYAFISVNIFYMITILLVKIFFIIIIKGGLCPACRGFYLSIIYSPICFLAKLAIERMK